MRILNPTGLQTLQSVAAANEHMASVSGQNLMPIDTANQLVNFNNVFHNLMNNVVKINAIIPDNFWSLQFERGDDTLISKEVAIFCSTVSNINVIDPYFDDISNSLNETQVKNFALERLASNGYRIKQLKIACTNSALFHNSSIIVYNANNNIVKRSFSLQSFISEYSFKDNVLTIDCDICVNILAILALDTSILTKGEIVSILLKIDDYHVYTF
jgi:hypothetical protein